jgi:hypothetical protein
MPRKIAKGKGAVKELGALVFFDPGWVDHCKFCHDVQSPFSRLLTADIIAKKTHVAAFMDRGRRFWLGQSG